MAITETRRGRSDSEVASTQPRDLDQTRQARGLLGKEADDERPEEHLLDVLRRPGSTGPPATARRHSVERDGQEDDERGAQERAADAPQTPEDDDEQDLERAVEIEAVGLDGARGRRRPRARRPRRSKTIRRRTRGVLARRVRTPTTAAAVSMSRTAIQLRPTRPRTRLRADERHRRDDEEREPVVPAGEDRSSPRTASGGAVMTPEALFPENQPTFVKSHSTKNCAASVETTR